MYAMAASLLVHILKGKYKWDAIAKTYRECTFFAFTKDTYEPNVVGLPGSIKWPAVRDLSKDFLVKEHASCLPASVLLDAKASSSIAASVANVEIFRVIEAELAKLLIDDKGEPTDYQKRISAWLQENDLEMPITTQPCYTTISGKCFKQCKVRKQREALDLGIVLSIIQEELEKHPLLCSDRDALCVALPQLLGEQVNRPYPEVLKHVFEDGDSYV